MRAKESIIEDCKALSLAYTSGALGQTAMPEDAAPSFAAVPDELRIAFFTLPMSLNYQRDSYRLWEAATRLWNDPLGRETFDVHVAATLPVPELQRRLVLHRVALQPNKHTATWQAICRTVAAEFGSFKGLLAAADNDFLRLRELVQVKHKRGFPYLSGPKIFNYWSFVLMQYCGVPLKNAEYIDIAPDTHVLQCSIKLGVLSEEEAAKFTREQVSERWRQILHGCGITPIQMHPPLWFWSRNGFIYSLR